MDIATITTLVGGGTILASGGVAWGAVKSALNGTRERVHRIEKTQKDHEDTHRELLDRAARTETKVDLLLERE